MAMLLAIDIGNTNVTGGVFKGEALKTSWRIATDPRRMADEYGLMLTSLLPLKGIDPKSITDAVLCSVVPSLISVLEEVCRSYFKTEPLIIGTGVKTGVRILYDSPRDVGTDRIVDAAAAFRLYGGPVIVVDFGTATVFDAVTKEGDYLGGAIHPGLGIAAESLFTSTAQLRKVELARPKSAIGKNTVASIQSGVVFGHIGMVEAMVKRFKEELGKDTNVIATGGYAPLIAKETDIFHAVNPDLTLIGLNMIYGMNH